MSLKIYFCGSIRAGRDDAALYAKIIDTLKTYGTVLTEHVENEAELAKDTRDDAASLTWCLEQMSRCDDCDPDKEIHDRVIEGFKTCHEKEITEKEIHDRDVAWLEESDVVVAEVTQPSLGVGYELGRAVAMGKHVLCLFRPDSGKRLSAMVQGAHNDEFIVKHYEEKEYPAILKGYFSKFERREVDS